MGETKAEVCLPTRDLTGDIGFFQKVLGMRMDSIFPADDPAVAVFSGHGLRLRMERGEGAAGRLRLLAEDPDTLAEGQRRLVSPGGTEVEIEALDPPLVMPATQHSFVVRRLRDKAPWVVGRAGMQYRDLIPDRLGGSIIASHIRIPDGGPVPDMVHFHKVGFQLIFCVAGWVDVVYEDQGGTRRLHAGDCFIQPPQIRHRVLEASDGIEVIEIGVPAEHVTEIDHEMTLPTGTERPDREWDGQRFVHNVGSEAEWRDGPLPGFRSRDTTIAANTRDVAGVLVLAPGSGEGAGVTGWTRHDADIHFTYVMSGRMVLEGEGRDPQELEQGDAFVIPPGMRTRYSEPSEDLQLLQVTLPGTPAIREG